MIGTAFLLAAFCVAGVLVFTGRQERRDYENYVASAEKYLEELDYESAQDAYLKAIEVDPRQADAYVGLAKTYLKQEDFDKAREILSQGQKSVSKEEAKRLISSGSDNGESGNPDNGSSIADEIDRLQVGKNYTWVVDPEIQADDIYYLKDENVMDYCRNDLNRQMETAYAVMKKDGKYGLLLESDAERYRSFVDTYMPFYGEFELVGSSPIVYKEFHLFDASRDTSYEFTQYSMGYETYLLEITYHYSGNALRDMSFNCDFGSTDFKGLDTSSDIYDYAIYSITLTDEGNVRITANFEDDYGNEYTQWLEFAKVEA